MRTSMSASAVEHGPPLVTGLTIMDEMALEDPAAEEAVIARHPPSNASSAVTTIARSRSNVAERSHPCARVLPSS